MQGRAHTKNALINAFVRGGSTEKYDPESIQQNHQLHLNVERIRVPETWFQPGMFGLDCAGVGEVAGWMMNGYDEELRRRLMQVRPCHHSYLLVADDTVRLCDGRWSQYPQSHSKNA